mmetsp:Transcript_3367/g.9898  ORF Transcript_3367/g.9898 Transcript_3367/m.9898 type:complete len:477 (+) Transcript_3367:205-1635(+)
MAKRYERAAVAEGPDEDYDSEEEVGMLAPVRTNARETNRIKPLHLVAIAALFFSVLLFSVSRSGAESDLGKAHADNKDSAFPGDSFSSESDSSTSDVVDVQDQADLNDDGDDVHRSQSERASEAAGAVDPNTDSGEPGNPINPARVHSPIFFKNLTFRECEAKHNFHSMPHPELCFNSDLLFLKGPKCASSTTAGLARRIAAHYGVHCQGCGNSGAVRASHPRLIAGHISHNSQLDRVIHNLNPSAFVWTFVREPAERCLSEFYHFRVTRRGVEPSDANVLSFASSVCNEYIWRYHHLDVHEDRVNFYGIVERMNESLLILAHRLGLTFGDIIFASAKVTGQSIPIHDMFGRPAKTLVPHIPLRKQSEEVQAYFHGEFMTKNTKEYTLYRRAHELLDDFIEKIGRDRFQEQLEYFNAMVKKVHAECEVYNKQGYIADKSQCYWRDNGCAYSCLDKYATDNELWFPVADYPEPLGPV